MRGFIKNVGRNIWQIELRTHTPATSTSITSQKERQVWSEACPWVAFRHLSS